MLPASAVATQPAAWTIGEHDGRKGILTPEGTAFIRALPETAPERERYEGFLKTGGSRDDAAFLRLIARERYTDSAAAFRAHDPHRLIFGERYGGFATPIGIREKAAKVVDVISAQSPCFGQREVYRCWLRPPQVPPSQ